MSEVKYEEDVFEKSMETFFGGEIWEYIDSKIA